MPLTLSRLAESARDQINEALNANLANGIDLYNAFKQAHWNLKGHAFGPLHALFCEIAGEVDGFNDRIAERVVALGGIAIGTTQIVASKSTITAYPADLLRDFAHVQALADRLGEYRAGLRIARMLTDRLGDAETSNMLQEIVLLVEKRGWFLLAHIDPAGIG